MAAIAYYSPFIPAFSSNGAPVAGAQLNFYFSGTTTRQPVYTTSALTTELPNPVVADAAGKFPSIYLNDANVYRVILTDAEGVQLGDAMDPYVPGMPAGFSAEDLTYLGTVVTDSAASATAAASSATSAAGSATSAAASATSATSAGMASVAAIGTAEADALASIATAETDAIAAVATAVAAVPTGAGQSTEGIGAPGYNVGDTGSFYYDTASGLLYGPKTASGWLGGVLTTRGTVPVTTRMDLKKGTFPTSHWTFTRGSVSTDLLYTDPYTRGYNSFAVDAPVIRSDKGFGSFMLAQQFLDNPTAPATHTTTANVAVGPAVLLVWGPAGSSVTVSAGTAVGTGWGTLNGDAGSFLTITISTAGTVTVTVSGAVTYFNLQQNSTLPSLTEPVPFIATKSTRSADKAVGTAAAVALLNSASGTLLMGLNSVTGRSYSRSATYLGLNATTAGYVTSNTAFSIYDPANHTTSHTVGNDNFTTGTTIGRTWDATSTVSFGGGTNFEKSHPWQHNNTAAVTACALGHPSSTNTYGSQQLNGFISFYEIRTGARLSDEALYNAYTTMPSPSLDSLLKNYVGPSQFRKFATAYRQCRAGIIDHVRVAIIGPSHEAGTGTGSNIRLNGWPPQMVTALEALGYAITDDGFAGANGNAFAAGTNPHDGRLTYTGTAPTYFASGFGGETVLIPSGGTLTFTPTRQTSKFIVSYATAASRGSLEVSIDGGTTPLAAGTSTNSAFSVGTLTFTAALGSNAWTMKAVGGAVEIVLGYAYNPLLKQIVLVNGGRSGYTVTNLATDNGSGSMSYALGVRTFAPHLAIGCSDQTNDMTLPTSAATYATKMAAIIANVQTTGDVLMFTDPPSSTATFTQSVQDTLMEYGRVTAWTNNVPLYDFASWKSGVYATLSASGYYGPTADTLHLAKAGQKRGKANQMVEFMTRLLTAV